MTDLLVHPASRPLVGSVPVPSDKSIGHRALLLAAICEGKSTLRDFSFGADNVSTLDALRAMGVQIERAEASVEVQGVGLFGLHAPAAPLECGNSGTTMRLLTGLLCAQPFDCTLVGDASLSRRPMMRIVGPLRARGARIDGEPHPKKQGDLVPPLRIQGLPAGEHLGPIEYDSPVSSAQVKSAILLSGLYAHGPTRFKEPTVSRDHTERMLGALGVPLRTVGSVVELDPAGWDGTMAGFELRIPGDLSAAAFLLVAGSIVPGSRVTTRGVGVNPTRTGILEIARDMGAGIGREPGGEWGGEPIAELHASAQPMRAARVGGEVVARAIDEIPIACALAARARGETRIVDAQELRVKESDRIRAMAVTLRAFGVTVEELPDGLVITGTDQPLRAAEVDSEGDHRIAMTAAVLALVADGPTRIRDVDCVATSFPRFVGTLRALGARVEVLGAGPGTVRTRSRPIVAIDGPAGAGKSTVARRLADALGYVLVDTGALYRVVALAAERRGVPWHDGPALGQLTRELVEAHAIRFARDPDHGPRVFLADEDVSAAIRTAAMGMGASQVSAHPDVRSALLDLQRQAGGEGGVVLEGRDIGTVVFPEAEQKFFLTASARVRASRRHAELLARGETATLEGTLAEVEQRDAQDAGREHAPLKQASDALLVDSTDMSIDEVVVDLAARVRAAERG